ncbi:ABC-2 type transport system permease protein [Actinocorallia herbida]|uniref:ABC-2 type transport system permease protein n=1 Tax=Actinocorallia herbida TaxID=58109 RepID=A0A3N1CSQ6_9ACTN|nr:ABC-2 family transporter protein [Actinocorallia herbida]ROO84245.1 ABC-2 type transport system permease protein [Actinocorallia herbida]
MTYALVCWFSFRRNASYRLAALGEAVSNTLFGFIRAYLLIALWEYRPHLGGYTVIDAITFCFLTQALIGPVKIFGGLDLTERVRTGDVAIDLHRPADLQLWWLADDLGRAAFTLLARGLPPMAAGLLAFGIVLPGGPGRWAAFLGSVVLAVTVSFALRYLVALAVFWIHDARGIEGLSLVCSLFFSGMILPLVVFPGLLGDVANALPWAALVQVPADVYLGKHQGWDLAGAYAFQAAWAAALLGLGRVLTGAAHRKLVIQGG